jgi:hypothetical protein
VNPQKCPQSKKKKHNEVNSSFIDKPVGNIQSGKLVFNNPVGSMMMKNKPDLTARKRYPSFKSKDKVRCKDGDNTGKVFELILMLGLPYVPSISLNLVYVSKYTRIVVVQKIQSTAFMTSLLNESYKGTPYTDEQANKVIHNTKTLNFPVMSIMFAIKVKEYFFENKTYIDHRIYHMVQQDDEWSYGSIDRRGMIQSDSEQDDADNEYEIVTRPSIVL